MPSSPLHMPAPRYAVHFAPNPGSLGWLTGSHWLGRCAASLQPLQQLAIDGVAPEQLHALTAAPRLHGWHAPLRPAPYSPSFVLAPGVDWLTLHGTVQQLADRFTAFHLPPLHVQKVDNYLALVPAQRLHAPGTTSPMHAIAAACEDALSTLTVPDTPPSRLAADGTEFLFHLPITGALQQVSADTQERVFAAAQEFFADLPALKFSSLALFHQPASEQDFRVLDHLELARS